EFLNALVTVRPPGRFKVLVVDKRSLQVLNKTLKLSEILEHDVVRIEKIENNRKDDPDVEALYILTPSKQSITRLINDFPASQQSHHHMQHPGAGGRPSGAHPGTSARKQPRYRCAHVFFTSELPNNLLKLIKSSGVTPYIKALRELCIEYDVHDSHVFLTRLFNHPLYRIYSPLISSLFNDELEMISKKLANVCGALKENPVVRYLLLDQEMHGDTKARPLAFLFHTEMDRIRDALPSDNTSKNKLQSELIIVDRSADPFAPVLHEFTYEAMVHDLLRVEDGNQVPYTVELANGTTESKMLKLDDSDQIWQEFRFHHISDAQQGIMKKFENLVGSNKAIADMQSGAKLNVSKMRDVVNKLPQFKEQVAVLSAHITIMQDCMEEFNNRCLKDLAMIEQNLAVGTTPEGEKYSAGDIDVADVLNNPDIKPKDKLRLLLIFFVANPSLTEQERQKLAHMAKLSREAREAIKNMGLVIRWSHALDLLKQLKQRPTQTTKPGKWGFGAIRGPNNKEEDENKPYDLSRYMPAFKNVLEDCITGNLSEDMFPYVDSRPSSGTQDTGAGPPRQIKSLRSGRPTWQKRDSAPASAHHGRSRIILFVIGGITLSEVRAAEEVARKQGREIIVGSTHIADPSSYLKEISSL
ncbi:Sec1-like protein, partial [Coemansia spiralis]